MPTFPSVRYGTLKIILYHSVPVSPLVHVDHDILVLITHRKKRKEKEKNHRRMEKALGRVNIWMGSHVGTIDGFLFVLLLSFREAILIVSGMKETRVS